MTQDELNAKLRYYLPGYVVDEGYKARKLKTVSTCYDSIVEITPQPFLFVSDTSF